MKFIFNDLLDGEKNLSIFQLFTHFTSFSTYALWGRKDYTPLIRNQDLNHLVKTLNNFENFDNIDLLHHAIIDFSDNDKYKEHDFTKHWENENMENDFFKYLRGLFTDDKPVKFPSKQCKNNFEICKFLMDKKINDPRLSEENKEKILRNPLTIKIYKKEEIKKILDKINNIDVKDPEIDIFLQKFNEIGNTVQNGGRLFFDKPNQDDKKCFNFWNSLQQQIDELKQIEMSEEDAYKSIRNDLALYKLKKILECKKKKVEEYDEGDTDDLNHYKDKGGIYPFEEELSDEEREFMEEHANQQNEEDENEDTQYMEEYADQPTDLNLGSSEILIYDPNSREARESEEMMFKFKCQNEIKKETSKCYFKKLIKINKLIKKINLYIELFELIKDLVNTNELEIIKGNIQVLEELKVKYNDKQKKNLSYIDDEFKVNGELNKLGKCIYDYYAIGKEPDLDPMPKPKPNPDPDPIPSPILPRKWVKPGNRIIRKHGIRNPVLTCYMNALLQAINATDYLYMDLLWTIQISGVLFPLTRYFDDTLRDLRNLDKQKEVIDPENTFCKAAWAFMGHKGQADSIDFLNRIIGLIKFNPDPTNMYHDWNYINSPFFVSVSYKIPEMDDLPETLTLQELIDLTNDSIIKNKNLDLEKNDDILKNNMNRYISNPDQRPFFTSDNDSNPLYANKEIITLASQNNIQKLEELLEKNEKIKNQEYTYDNATLKHKANDIFISCTNALRAIKSGDQDKLSEQKISDYYLPSNLLYTYVKNEKGKYEKSKIKEEPEIIETLSQELQKPFIKIERKTPSNPNPPRILEANDTILATRDYKPYIILENHHKIMTTNNCHIIIDDQNFTLKAVIMKFGGTGGGHYWTYTPQGVGDDSTFINNPHIFRKYCDEGHKDATFYFFENNIQPTSFIVPEISGGSITNKYYSKYLKYKNKYLELSKLKKSKY
jgi:hypothetical protein